MSQKTNVTFLTPTRQINDTQQKAPPELLQVGLFLMSFLRKQESRDPRFCGDDKILLLLLSRLFALRSRFWSGSRRLFSRCRSGGIGSGRLGLFHAGAAVECAKGDHACQHCDEVFLHKLPPLKNFHRV